MTTRAGDNNIISDDGNARPGGKNAEKHALLASNNKDGSYTKNK